MAKFSLNAPFICALLMLFSGNLAFAQDEAASPATEEKVEASSPAAPAQDCSRETLLAFFPKAIVYKVLEKYDVPKDKWDAIYDDLEVKDRNVIRTVEEKAARMDPNPLKDLKHRSQAIRLFRQTLIESFTSVMEDHGITNSAVIEEMLDDIQIEKARAFADCMEQIREN